MKFTYLETARAVRILCETGVRESQTFKNLMILAERTKFEDEKTIYAIMSALSMTSQCIYVNLLEREHARKIWI